MSNWIRFNRGNCPVCSGARRDCRQNQDSSLVHCRSASANPPDWILRGEDAWGFGIWAYAADAEAWTEERREEWRREQSARKQKRERREQERNQRALSAKERDREIRKILSQLSLSDRHQQLVIKRGLTDAQIEQNGYRSIAKWQKLDDPVSNRLAGTSECGNQLNNPCDGILCPVANSDGQYIGMRLHNPQSQENGIGKYIWLSSSRRNVTNHDQNGENPIAVYYPENYEHYDKIGLCEGLEFKSAIAANQLGYPVIGFGGCNFGSSPKALEQAIALIKQKLNIEKPTFVLLGDGGCVLNKQVTQGYAKVVRLLETWNYQQVQYAWWGQVQKNDGDIDEINSATISKIAYLSPQDFNQLVKKHRKVIEIDQWQQQQEKTKDRTWKELTSLTASPWLEVDTPNLAQIGLEDKLERGHIYLVISAKATGKTKTVKPLIDQFTNIYSWFNRIALGREECHKLGLDYKDDLKSYQGFLKVGFCANSAYQFHPKHLKNNGLLLGDESDQLLSYLFESICNKNGIRPGILKALEAHLKATIAGNGMALFMSADNSDIEYEFLQQIAPEGCEVRVIVNHYQPPKGRVYFDTSSSPDGSINELVENLQNGVSCFVIDDVKNGVKGCKSIAEYIRNTLPNLTGSIVEINSDTSGSEEIQNYLKDINNESLNTLLLICSPSVISGISIENGHFKRGYGFYNGVLTTKESSQSLVRVRGLENLTVWAAEKGFTWAGDRSLTPEGIRDYYQRNYTSNSKYLSSFDVDYDPLTDEWSSPWFELYCKYAAYRNLSMTNLRLRLREKLFEEGYSIVEVAPEPQEDTEPKLKESWGKINLERANAIESAHILTDDELEKLSNSFEATTPSQQLDVEKTILLKRYGQPLADAVTHTDKYTGECLTGYAALYLKDDGGKWYGQLKQLYYLLDNYDEATKSDRRKESQQEFHGARFVGDISWNARKRQLRKHLGIDQLIDPEWRQPQEYEQLAMLALKQHRQVKDTTGLSVKKLYPAQIYTELVSQLGLKTESSQIKQLTADGKKTIRLRRITPESRELAELFIVHREGLRLQRTTNKSEPNKPKEAVTPPPIFISRKEGGVLPSESHVDNGFQTSKIVKKTPSQEAERITQNVNTKLHNSIEQNTTEYSLDSNKVKVFDSSEAIADLADMLTYLESAEGLAELQRVPEFTRARLNRATRLLPVEWQQKIRQWAVENRSAGNGMTTKTNHQFILTGVVVPKARPRVTPA
jgi:hypothetical protein